MFEISLSDPVELRDADDAALLAAIEDCARAEVAAGARRLSAIAELTSRRTGNDQRADWACDGWDCAAAEVAAALTVSHRKASGQMHLSLTLNRLPQVAALFLAGQLSARLVSIIAWRTYLVRDPEALSLLDAALAKHATAWGPLSAPKLEKAIDSWIDRYDPAALRRTRISARSRDLCIGDPDEDAGTAALWGRLFATDAAMLDKRLTQLAHGVCDDDPRTIAQRRADALGALAAGADRLTCGCGNSDCPSSAGNHRQATGVVIHVVADAAALGAAPDPRLSGPEPALAPEAPATPAVKPPAALISGGGCGARATAGRADPRWGRPQPRAPSRRSAIGAALPAVGQAGRIRPDPRHDLPIPRLRPAHRILRHRPHTALPTRAHPPVQPEMPLPQTPPSQDLLDRLA
ncbi:DUF222 domain-containing protein [Mycobacterium tuberculosis]|uniref:DUF222 domain-containing protein n=1 Tax=Mycobacterium tuberculosis TaxID=1773 RepID=UPI0005DC6F22|nr:DUF222 domain-containing protein [Mycobacterium tuberculosis]CKR27327.1 Conserved protein of uncharacterised function. Member of Mycobacterium tuberculosis REP13E12 [Mycobacterium tuberculosis]